ncbi:MAG: HD domain-containing protein [Clostridiales bacterium]|nr:HD domain-containing protein [Clostridiales bacterium]
MPRPKPNEKTDKPAKNAEPMAVIDVGSNELRLRIAENKGGVMKFLESASVPLNLGGDTFAHGRISFEKLGRACEIIKNFLTLSADYGVSQYKVVATTAVRESENRDYILDQIKIKTGVSVSVIDDSEEKLYVYKLMSHLAPEEFLKSAMMVYTGSGNVGLSVWRDGRSFYSESVKIGSLRISEVFGDMQDYCSCFPTLADDYIKSYMCLLDGDFSHKIKHFITSGQEISMIADLTGAASDSGFYHIEAKKLSALFEEIKSKSVERVASDYDISEEKAEVLLPALCIYRALLNFTEAEVILTPLVYLTDALMFEMLYPDQFSRISRELDKSTLLSARAISEKFRDLTAHSALVEKFAVQIFDKLKKIHGMGKREKLLLQTAAILHDVGKYVNIKHHSFHSRNIICGCEIIGLNGLEKEIVAQICRYHSKTSPNEGHADYARLPVGYKVLVSKLAAILKLADALDRGHNQKFSGIEAALNDDGLVITVTTSKNIDLEIWYYSEKSRLFEEVFGIKTAVRHKKPV